MKKPQKFEIVTADDNLDYYCPLGTTQKNARPKAEQLGHCVGADVVGRYSGHLDLAK